MCVHKKCSIKCLKRTEIKIAIYVHDWYDERIYKLMIGSST